MGQLLHACARTTEKVRRDIQNSEESLSKLSKRYGINPKTVAKWRSRKGEGVADRKMGSKSARSVLSAAEEAVICEFRPACCRQAPDAPASGRLLRLPEGPNPEAQPFQPASLSAKAWAFQTECHAQTGTNGGGAKEDIQGLSDWLCACGHR